MDWEHIWKGHERAVAAGGVWLLGVIALLLPWYGANIGFFGVGLTLSANGLGSSITAGTGTGSTVGWAPLNLLFIVGVVVAGVGCARAARWIMGRDGGTGSWAQLLLAGAALELVGVIGYLISASGAFAAKGASGEGAVEGGAILAILAALALAGLAGWEVMGSRMPGLLRPPGPPLGPPPS